MEHKFYNFIYTCMENIHNLYFSPNFNMFEDFFSLNWLFNYFQLYSLENYKPMFSMKFDLASSYDLDELKGG
jgi:hypothetical protein